MLMAAAVAVAVFGFGSVDASFSEFVIVFAVVCVELGGQVVAVRRVASSFAGDAKT